MKLALSLDLKKAPRVGHLITSDGGYRPKAVADTINACRAHGSAQLLVSYDDRMGGSWLDDVIVRATSEIKAMAVEGEVFEIEVVSISEDARRVDVIRTILPAASSLPGLPKKETLE